MISISMSFKEMFFTSLELWGAILSFICAILLLRAGGRRRRDFRILAFAVITNGFLLTAEALTFVLDGKVFPHSNWIIPVIFFLDFGLIPILFWFLTWFFAALLGPDSSRPMLTTATIMSIVSLSVLCVSQKTHWYYFFDSENLYQRGSLFWLHTVILTLFMLIILVHVIVRRKRIPAYMFGSLIFFAAICLAAGIVHLWLKGYSLTYVAFTIGLIAIITCSLHDQAQEIASEQARMQELNTRLVVSQIKPHFVYNALNTIYYLIKKDPDLARSTLAEFSEYMRQNGLALSREKPVSFLQEIEHVKRYLSLEQKRFGDKLKVEYDLEAEHFTVPSLSVQPLVENAVKHGLGNKPEGGTVRISSREEKKAYIIEIKDDGVGFDSTDPKLQNPEEHLGIVNVSTRIEVMCNGKLDITSSLGDGTTAVITIPKS